MNVSIALRSAAELGTTAEIINKKLKQSAMKNRIVTP
jgi:hypothetical protein